MYKMRQKIKNIKKILIGLCIGLILNISYFGWEYQEYIYYFFEPCQLCNNQEIKNCDYCEGVKYEIENCKQCING